MSTRKRKQDDEELVALPSDDSEEEEEYVIPTFPPHFVPYRIQDINWTLCSFTVHIRALQCDMVDDKAVCADTNAHMSAHCLCLPIHP